MAEPLKNYFSKYFITELGENLNSASKNFNQKKFEQSTLNSSWSNLELKERMHCITEQMHKNLEGDFSNQILVLNKIAPKFTGLTAMVFPNFVEKYGQHDFKTSLQALHFYTRFSTSEFAIRPFLKKQPDTIKVLYDWAKDKNFHVRRLASEGCRPLLPWAMKLEQYVLDPKPILPILERLINDKEDYVYRSVANNFNDISKHHPKLVLSLAKKWQGQSDSANWAIKHGLRTLLKKGNQDAMKLFGFSNANYKIKELKIEESTIKIGNSTNFSFSICNTGASSKLRLEYVISYLKNNGKLSDKVFQISEKLFAKNETLNYSKKLNFFDLTTRKHYPGEHFLSLKINGVVAQKIKFNLK